MPIATRVRHHSTPTRMAIKKEKQKMTSVGEDVIRAAGGKVKRSCCLVRRSAWWFLKREHGRALQLPQSHPDLRDTRWHFNLGAVKYQQKTEKYKKCGCEYTASTGVPRTELAPSRGVCLWETHVFCAVQTCE